MLERVRLISGLILVAFIVCHSFNHALGVFSLDVVETGSLFLNDPWGKPPLLWVLWLVLPLHACVSLATFLRRRSFHISALDLIQVITGILIALVMMSHLYAQLVLVPTTNLHMGYELLPLLGRVFAPLVGIEMALGLTMIWLHLGVGLYLWLGHHQWFNRWRWVLAVPALLLPSWGLAGFLALGTQSQAWPDQVGKVEAIFNKSHFSPEVGSLIMDTSQRWSFVLGMVIIVLILARVGSHYVAKRPKGPKLFYGEGRVVALLPYASVLETVRSEGIPHGSICGGRGRCSVCRVRLGKGGEHLPPPDEAEKKVLERVGAPYGVRLACQIYPEKDLHVTPLLPPNTSVSAAFSGAGRVHGQELEIAVLFADLREFTAFSEKRLPFDVVFVLNRYFQLMGEAVEKSGGHLDKFIGDGVMALFGMTNGPKEGCRDALRCALLMVESLEHMNRQMAGEMTTPLRMGIGIHVGEVIVGEMGYGSARHVTALGDVVNTASRLEGMTKSLGVPLIVSEPVASLAGLALDAVEEMTIRGRSETLRVCPVFSIESLAGV